MFEKNDIEKMLENYLENKSKIENVDNQIEKNNVLIKYNEKQLKITDEEAIENMSLNAVKTTEVISKTNKISKTTENVALNYEKQRIYNNKCDIYELRRENAMLNLKIQPLKEEIEKVETMLKALDNEQKLIIKSYYFYDKKWNNVYITYVKAYQTERTINQLKNIRDKALNKMLSIVNF